MVYYARAILDHIGAVPYIIMPRIDNPPLYARFFTSLMIKKRQEEFHLSPLTINVIEKETFTLGDLKVRFFGVSCHPGFNGCYH